MAATTAATAAVVVIADVIDAVTDAKGSLASWSYTSMSAGERQDLSTISNFTSE